MDTLRDWIECFPPRERGPSVLNGLVVTPPTEELLERIDRAERGEEEMEPKMEPNVNKRR